MAAPNLGATSLTITGRTTAVSLSTTSATVVVANSSASGMVLKVNTLVVANDDGVNSADITLVYNTSSGGGGTSFAIANTIAVPADASLDVLNKPLYLEENKSILATASTGSDLDVIISYEEISETP